VIEAYLAEREAGYESATGGSVDPAGRNRRQTIRTARVIGGTIKETRIPRTAVLMVIAPAVVLAMPILWMS
jgi:hypothetical protein